MIYSKKLFKLLNHIIYKSIYLGSEDCSCSLSNKAMVRGCA